MTANLHNVLTEQLRVKVIQNVWIFVVSFTFATQNGCTRSQKVNKTISLINFFFRALDNLIPRVSQPLVKENEVPGYKEWDSKIMHMLNFSQVVNNARVMSNSELPKKVSLNHA